MIGDLNIDLNKPENKGWWFDTCLSNGSRQLISEDTRVTVTSSTKLDHIYTNRINNISNSGVIHYSLSDHFMTFFGRKINISLKSNKSIDSINNFKLKSLLEAMEYQLDSSKCWNLH